MMQVEKLKILIRMPNWLGDIVMATAFLNAVNEEYPEANVDLIIKKGFEFLVDHLASHNSVFIFDKIKFKGANGAFQFGKELRKNEYDLFFCLPNSFSSAIMGYGTKAKQRIGFAKEWRNLLLTKNIKQPKKLHRVEEYVYLLDAFTGKKTEKLNVHLLPGKNHEIIGEFASEPEKNFIIVNINSEASSRRIPVDKAISLLHKLKKNIEADIVLIGSPKEKEFVQTVYNSLSEKKGIVNMAGKTSMQELIELIGRAKLMLTTDSGPAHVSNALGIFTIVLFGAGNENNTAPYSKEKRKIIRLGKLECEPCLKNKCPLYNKPHCLTLLDDDVITNEVIKMLY